MRTFLLRYRRARIPLNLLPELPQIISNELLFICRFLQFIGDLLKRAFPLKGIV